MKKSLLTIIAITGFVSAYADVSGRILTHDNEPVHGAAVALISLPDSVYSGGAATEADGRFVIATEQNPAEFLLSVQAYGYEPVMVHSSQHTDNEIHLQLVSTELREVVVTGQAPVMRRQGEKFIFIPNALADDVYDANALMSHVPMVSWSDRSVQITGKGISKVYLNGRDPNWDQVEISAMLRTLDPHNIKRVEIITDPGASQQASFNGGVINIIYDDPFTGWRGNFNTSLRVNNEKPSVYPNLWLNYQRGKFKASTNLTYGFIANKTDQREEYDFTGQGKRIVNDTYTSQYSHYLMGKLNLSYDLSKRSVAGVALRLGGMYSHSHSTVHTLTETDTEQTHSFLKQVQESPMNSPHLLALAYYTLYTDNKGSMLDVIAAYGSGKSQNNYTNDFNSEIEQQDFSDNGYAFSGKATYRQVFDPRTNLSVGFEVTDQHNKKDESIGGDFHRFNYYERQLHGFVQFNRSWTPYVATSVGLRLENTHYTGSLTGDEQRYTQDYTSLFPSLSVSYTLPSGVQSMSLSYERGISRPTVGMLDPYKRWSSDNSYAQGNPDLKPQYNDYVSLSFTIMQGLIIRASYNYASNLTTGYTFGTPDGYTISSYTNSGHSHYTGAILSYNKRVNSLWITGADISGHYRRVKTMAQGQEISSAGWDGSLSWENTFMISRARLFQGRLSQSVITPSNRGIDKTPWRYIIHASLSKGFNCGLYLSAYVGVPIAGYKRSKFMETPVYSYRINQNLPLCSFEFSLSYTFGKSRVQGAQDRTDEVSK